MDDTAPAQSTRSQRQLFDKPWEDLDSDLLQVAHAIEPDIYDVHNLNLDLDEDYLDFLTPFFKGT